MTPEVPRYCCRIHLMISETQPVCSLTVSEMHPDCSLTVESLNVETTLILSEKIINRMVDVDYYDGSYDITPLAYDAQVLPTKDTYCDDDILVRQVPYYETSNLSGGNTVYIADGGDG